MIKITRLIKIHVISLALWLLIPGLAGAAGSIYDFRDFNVRVEKFAVDKNPYARVEISLDGTGTYIKQVKTESMEVSRVKKFKVTVQQLEYLYYQVMRARFFSIAETFGNPNMREGTVVRVSVKFDSERHVVTMYDERYLAVDEVVSAVLALMPKNLREDYEKKSMDFSEIKLP